MAHQSGWIELYEILEKGGKPESELVHLCKSSRTGIGETMLHGYAIEGSSDVLQKPVDLGFSVNVENEFVRGLVDRALAELRSAQWHPFLKILNAVGAGRVGEKL